MGKLDEILEQHKEWLRGIQTDRLIGVGTEPTKQLIKELFLEVINESQDNVAHDNRHTVYGFGLLSSELRKKIEAL